jgi:hypothetical protein
VLAVKGVSDTGAWIERMRVSQQWPCPGRHRRAGSGTRGRTVGLS